MTQSITKRHHFISQMLLRHFTDESGTLFFFSKQFPDKGVLATTPANLFCQTHLYTARDKNGVMDLGLEQQYSELESLASPVIDKIITSVRLGHEPHLTSEERKIWDLFLCNQWKRVPEVGQKVLDQEDAETRIRKFATVFDTNVRKLTPDEVRNLEDLRWLERVKQNAMVSALKRPSPGVLAALEEKGLCIGIISKPDKSFVIGSMPVVKMSHPGRELLPDPTVELWLPVAFDVAVTLTTIPSRNEIVCEINDDSIIRQINHATLRQSRMIAGRSEKLVTSLSRSR